MIRQLFPRLDEKTISTLKRAKDVVYLIGMKHPSWHPDRAERATTSDGDLHVYRGRFGVCVGGRHPLIKEETKKSNSLFIVNHVYHSNVATNRHVDSIVSHELEYCPKRCVSYTGSDKRVSNKQISSGESPSVLVESVKEYT